MLRRHSALMAICAGLLFLMGASESRAQVDALPLWQADQLGAPIGGFKVGYAGTDKASTDRSSWGIAFTPGLQSMYLQGHPSGYRVAELAVPPGTFGQYTALAELPTAQTLVQGFSLARPTQNPSQIDALTGLTVIGNRLCFGGVDRYAGDHDQGWNTACFEDRTDLTQRPAQWRRMPGGAHFTRWASPVPVSHRALVGAKYIVGGGIEFSITGRQCVGVCAAGFDLASFYAGLPPGPFAIFQRRTLTQIIAQHGGDDDVLRGKRGVPFTYRTLPAYGVIVPGTRTYAAFGHAAGIESGICYKTEQCGYPSGGFDPKDPADQGPYYWLYDTAQWQAVTDGTLAPELLEPYAHGKLPAPYGIPDYRRIGAASFDPASGRLALLYERTHAKGAYIRLPSVVFYQLAAGQGDLPPFDDPPVEDPPFDDPPVEDPLIAELTEILERLEAVRAEVVQRQAQP